MGQLLTETVNGLVVNPMEYDNYGNIVKKNGKVYTYGDAAWKDLLTSYNGQAITYDAQGNPTEYLGHTLTWEKGRQLKSFDGNTYTYNANGIRTGKTVNGVRHTYTLDGTKILREAWGGNTIVPMYDNEDSVCGILYNDVPYYFIKNLQGDVVAIVDKDAQTVAKYTYDAWGVCTITQDTTDCNIAGMNPYRYRGYYFDAEIGLYYLQSRYYDAGVGRFLNSDEAIIAALLYVPNAYSYCQSTLVNFSDHTGAMSTGTAALEFVTIYGTSLSTAVLSTKVLAFLSAIAPYLIMVFAVVLAAVLVYYAAKAKSKGKTKIPDKLKSGGKIKTPQSHKGEFTKKRGGSYTHNKTGWRFEKSKDGHYNGEHWHASPPNGKTGDYYNISPDGRELG